MRRYIEFAAAHRATMAQAPIPEPGAGEGLVVTSLSGISVGTERMWLDGSAGALRSGRRGYPYRPGYELVGRIAGAGFAGIPVGGRVFAMKPHGSHAVLGRDDSWLPLPDHVADEDAIAIALTATALHAVHRSSMTVGDAAMVAGLGALGLIMIQVLAASFAGPVIALTRNAAKGAIARAHGATRVVTYDTLGDAALPPAQCIFECSGVAANVPRLLPLARAQGELVLVGSYTAPIILDGETIFAKELTVKGVRASGAAAGDNEFNRWDRRRNLELAGALVAAGTVRMRGLVTHRFAAERFDEAYRLIADPARRADAIQICLLWREGAR